MITTNSAPDVPETGSARVGPPNGQRSGRWVYFAMKYIRIAIFLLVTFPVIGRSSEGTTNTQKWISPAKIAARDAWLAASNAFFQALLAYPEILDAKQQLDKMSQELDIVRDEENGEGYKKEKKLLENRNSLFHALLDSNSVYTALLEQGKLAESNRLHQIRTMNSYNKEISRLRADRTSDLIQTSNKVEELKKKIAEAEASSKHYLEIQATIGKKIREIEAATADSQQVKDVERQYMETWFRNVDARQKNARLWHAQTNLVSHQWIFRDLLAKHPELLKAKADADKAFEIFLVNKIE